MPICKQMRSLLPVLIILLSCMRSDILIRPNVPIFPYFDVIYNPSMLLFGVSSFLDHYLSLQYKVMANVHGFRDMNNNPQNRRNNNAGQGNLGQNMGNVGDDQIPFLTTMKSDRQPMQETIPYTLRLICCPDFRVCSTTLIFLITVWVMYVFCLTQGVEKENKDVLQVQLSVLIDYGAAEGVLIQQGEVYRLITASFLHVDLMHIIMNSISLLFLCTRFEKIYRVYTPFVLLASSITGFTLSVLCSPNNVTVGASTAIFGILGGFIAFLMINWTELERFGPIRSTIACIMAFIIFISLLFSIGSSIDFIAHIGGLIGGIFISLAILPGMGVKNKVFMWIGIGGIVIMNLTTLLMLFLA